MNFTARVEDNSAVKDRDRKGSLPICDYVLNQDPEKLYKR
jgi:hypothetical protein